MSQIKKFLRFWVKSEKAYPIYSAILSSLVFLLGLAFLDILGFDNNIILFGDLEEQYIPFIKMFLRAIMGQNDYWYSLSLYLGSGTALTYAYYCINPFNLIYLIDNVPVSILTTILITAKIALGAATFNFFESKGLNLHRPSTILFSLCYTLGGFTASMYTNIIWLDAIYMLPILTYLTMKAANGLNDPHKTGKTVRFPFFSLTISFAYLFITNFYMGFIEGVFLALVFVLSFFRNHSEKKLQDFFKLGIMYAATVLLAAALCATVLLPAAGFLFSHQATDNEEFEELFATVPDIINSFFIASFPSLDNNIPFLYCGLPVLLLVPFFFTIKTVNKKDRLLVAVILIYYLVCMLVLPLYKFMHVFDYPNWYAYRFSFCISFTLTAIAAITYEHIVEINMKVYSAYTISLIVLYSAMIPICTSQYEWYQLGNNIPLFWINTLFLVLYLLLFLFYRKCEKKCINYALKTCFSILLISEIVINIYVTDQKRGTLFSESAEQQWLTEADAVNEIKSADSGLYRISVKNETNTNAAAWFGYAGLNTFSSSDDYNLRRTLYNLGIQAPNRCIFDAGYTPVTYALMGAKYKVNVYSEKDELTETGVADSEPTANIVPAEINSFDNYLPLLLMSSDKLLDYTPGKNPFINQETLVSAIAGTEYHFFDPVAREDLLEGNYNTNMDENPQVILFTKKSPLSPLAYYSFNLPHSDDKTLYGYFYQQESAAKRNAMFIIGEIDGWWETADMHRGSIVRATNQSKGNYRYITNIDDSVSYDSISVYTDSTEIETDTCRDLYFYTYPNNGALKELCDDLTSTAPTLTSFSDSDINAYVSVKNDRTILFTTIPYDKDWHIYCDGEEINTLPLVENAFLGAELSPGNHEIRLKYTARFAKEGLIISIAAVVFIIVLGFIRLVKGLTKADHTQS